MRFLTTLIKYIIFAIVILMLFGFSLFDNPKRYRFLIPEKFNGTVYVYFQVSDAPPLKMEDGYQLIVIPESGVVKTSSEPIGGKLHDEYWLYSADGKRRRMPPEKMGGGGTVERKNASGQHEIFYQFNILK